MKATFLHLLLRCWVAAATLLLLGGTVHADIPVYGYKIVESHPHNPRFFTQGLLMHDGYLYEGTGRYGQSALMQIRLEDGEVIRSRELSSRFFGEGIAVANGLIYQLTWRENTAFVYDLETFATVTSHYVPTEGWGLTWDGEHLILSDGTDQLCFIEPETFSTVRTVDVTLGGQPIRNLNELEYINGEVWANVWMTEQLVRIDPASGHVLAVVDLTGLKLKTNVAGPANEAVLNGIAWDAVNERLLVTGKLWSHVFEITLEPRN